MKNYRKHINFCVIPLFTLLAYTCNSAIATSVIVNQRSPVYSFVNHKNEILALRDKLEKTRKVALTGISGKGKSELVNKYVEQYKDKYEIIAFLNVDIDLIPQLIILAKNINNTICLQENIPPLPVAPSTVEQGIINFLSPRDKWLLIFDNIKLNQGHKIKKFMEWENKGEIIVTSQDSNFIENRIEMPYLKDSDAEVLIRTIIPNISKDLAEKIIKKCKGHPYLLNHIATFISNHNHKNLDEVIAYVENNNNPIEEFTNLLLSNINNDQKDLLLKVALMNNYEISKPLLSTISGENKADLIKNIHELVKLGVLEQVSVDIENPLFQLHDVLKNELIKKFPKKVFKKTVDDLLTSVIEMLPKKNKTKAYVILSEDGTLISNIEKLLDNADYYEADIHKAIELRTHLLDYYIDTRDAENCKRLVEWMNSKQGTLGKMNDAQKDFYAYYLTKIGFYEEFANNDYYAAIDYYKKALGIATMAQPRTRLIANWQLANAQISLGQLANALRSINEAVKGQDPEIIKDNRIWYLQGRLLLAQGNYKKALEEVNEGLEIYMKANDRNSGTAINTLLFKAEILNYMGNYKEAYKIANEIHLINKEHLINRLVTDSKILIQLAKAEQGLGEAEKALSHIDKVISYLKQDIGELSSSSDKNLADALVVKGDILNYLSQTQEAVDLYDKAENIYYNRYRQNTKNMDEVSYALSQGAKAACANNNNEWYNKFKGRLIKYFGKDHKKVLETHNYCNNLLK